MLSRLKEMPCRALPMRKVPSGAVAAAVANEE